MRGRRLLRIMVADLPVKVICLAAAVILFLFHRINTLTERFFSVPLNVVTPSGLAISSPYPKTVRITLRGAEEAIFPVLEEDVEASVNLEKHRGPGEFREQVRVERKGTALNVEPLEIRVEPQQLTFNLEPLVEQRVNVIPDIRGSPAYGYKLAQSSLIPPSVVIRGAKSRVQAITTLSTEEIDLTGRTGSFTARLKVILPNSLVRIAGDQLVDFRATIQESIVVKWFESVEIVSLELSPRLALKSPLAPGRVEVQGTEIVVEGIRPDQVRLLLDCSTLKKPGIYTLHPRPETPSGLTIVDFEPKSVKTELVSSGK